MAVAWQADLGGTASLAGVRHRRARCDRAPPQRVHDADLHVAPLVDLPFDDASFDLVLMDDVLGSAPPRIPGEASLVEQRARKPRPRDRPHLARPTRFPRRVRNVVPCGADGLGVLWAPMIGWMTALSSCTLIPRMSQGASRPGPRRWSRLRSQVTASGGLASSLRCTRMPVSGLCDRLGVDDER